MDFCNKYGVELGVLRKYLSYLEMGDLLNADVYHVLLCENCQRKQLDELKKDLDNIIKKYFEKI